MNEAQRSGPSGRMAGDRGVRISRRRMLAASAAALAAGAARRAPAAPIRRPPDVGKLTAYQLGPHVWVRWKNRLLTSYRAHPTQKYPYFYPLRGPVSGLSLTTETSEPYPHHRSLLFACDRVNGANFWQADLAAGQIISRGPRLGEVSDTACEILDACDWRRPGGPVVMRDERRMVVSVPNERLRFIDVDIRWIAVQDVTVTRTNHSLFALRAEQDLAPWGGGRLENANGQSGEEATFGQPAAWCGYYGRRAGMPERVVEGVAILDHPENPWSPCPWFTRDYGFISPTPMNFLKEPWRLPADASVRLRYRVVLHAGDQAQAGLDRIYEQWTA